MIIHENLEATENCAAKALMRDRTTPLIRMTSTLQRTVKHDFETTLLILYMLDAFYSVHAKQALWSIPSTTNNLLTKKRGTFVDTDGATRIISSFNLTFHNNICFRACIPTHFLLTRNILTFFTN